MPAHPDALPEFAVLAMARYVYAPGFPRALSVFFYNDVGPGDELLFDTAEHAVEMLQAVIEDIQSLPERAGRPQQGWQPAARAARHPARARSLDQP